MSRPDVYRKRPSNWTTDIKHSCDPTTWVDVNKGDANRPEHRSRLCGNELKRCEPTMPGTFASMGPLECSKALMWKLGASGASARKIVFIYASKEHCQADATSETAIELPPEEQMKGGDLIRELLKSLYGTRKQRKTGIKSGRECSLNMNL